jgi:hypothetical protein
MRPPPCVQVRTSPVVQMKRKPPSRAAEELYVAIRESMTRSGVLSSSFKFSCRSTSRATPSGDDGPDHRQGPTLSLTQHGATDHAPCDGA